MPVMQLQTGTFSQVIVGTTIKFPQTSSLTIEGSDAVTIVGSLPYITMSDSSSGYAHIRIQNDKGSIGFATETTIRAGNVPFGVEFYDGKPGEARVLIRGQDALQIAGPEPFLTFIDGSNNRKAKIQSVSGSLMFWTNNRTLPDQKPMMVIHDDTSSVTIDGKLNCFDVQLSGADCAENFDIYGSSEVEAGSVMIIGDEGSLRPCENGYDKRACGVISGAGECKPGITLGHAKTAGNKQPLALVGKVYCKVDAQYGSLEIGDLLTTSPTKGHAMKAADPYRAFGAVIGKALSPLTEGQGLVPILIALQ